MGLSFVIFYYVAYKVTTNNSIIMSLIKSHLLLAQWSPFLLKSSMQQFYPPPIASSGLLLDGSLPAASKRNCFSPSKNAFFLSHHPSNCCSISRHAFTAKCSKKRFLFTLSPVLPSLLSQCRKAPTSPLTSTALFKVRSKLCCWFFFFWKRQRVSEREGMSWGGAERETENLKQTPCCQHRVPCSTRSHNPGIMTWAKIKSQTFNLLSHAGAPCCWIFTLTQTPGTVEQNQSLAIA